MKEHDIKAAYRQPKRHRVQEQQTYEAENILNRNFKQTATNRVGVTDIPKFYMGSVIRKFACT